MATVSADNAPRNSCLAEHAHLDADRAMLYLAMAS